MENVNKYFGYKYESELDIYTVKCINNNNNTEEESEYEIDKIATVNAVASYGLDEPTEDKCKDKYFYRYIGNIDCITGHIYVIKKETFSYTWNDLGLGNNNNRYY